MALKAYIGADDRVRFFETHEPNADFDSLPAQTQELISANPDKKFQWNGNDIELMPEPAETLEQAKARVKSEIDQWESSLLTTFDSEVAGHPVYIHDSAQNTIANMLTLVESQLGRAVKTESDILPLTVADQSAVVMITYADYRLLADEVVEHVATVRAVASGYRQAVDDAASLAEFPETPYTLGS